MMINYYRRCVRKGIADPEIPSGAKISYDGYADRWEKDETYRQDMSLHGHTKAELQSWDTKMGPKTANHIGCVKRHI